MITKQEKSENELQQEAEDLAGKIKVINAVLYSADIDLLKKSAEDMARQASWQDSAAVLNPRYNPKKSENLRLSAKALSLLAEYHETLVEITKLKADIATEDEHYDKIAKMFM